MPRVGTTTNGHAPASGLAKRLAEIMPARDESLELPGEVKTDELSGVPAMALDPNLIELLVQDFAAMGVVGERDTSLLVYCTTISRKQEEPLRIILSGASGSGKSQVQQKIGQLCPPEDVINATSLTANALYYATKGSLKHKHLNAGERSHRSDEEQAERTAAIRQMLSEHRISKLTTVKEDGQMISKLIEQEGPISYCETTTSASIFAEDLNRCLLVPTDDSPAQTARVLVAIAEGFNGVSKAEKQAIVDRHHEFQRALQPCRVTIPFAAKLAEGFPEPRAESHLRPLNLGVYSAPVVFCAESREPKSSSTVGSS